VTARCPKDVAFCDGGGDIIALAVNDSADGGASVCNGRPASFTALFLNHGRNTSRLLGRSPNALLDSTVETKKEAPDKSKAHYSKGSGHG